MIPINLRSICLLLCLLPLGCKESELDADQKRPLRPLIYTELPKLTPEGAKVRERRLMRQLVEGKGLEDKRQKKRLKFPAPTSASALGKLLFHALISRDEFLWEQAFVSPRSYASLVRVKLPKARQFVDNTIGASLDVWRLFEVEHESEVPEGGLISLFELESFELGQPRLASGKRPTKSNPKVQQYWGSTLKIRLKQSPSTIFTLHLPKIVFVPDRRKLKTGEALLALAAPIKATPGIRTFVAAGLHLKPELLRSQDYPYPLAVGNFWRYRRIHVIDESQPVPKPKATKPEDAVALVDESSSATTVSEALWEITRVERYDTWRLVQYRQSYNDQELTEVTKHWLVTPKHIYPCSRACIKQIGKLNWLLPYMERTEPYFRFPLTKSWERLDVTVSKGDFLGIVKIPHDPKTALTDPLLTLESSIRYFSPGQGVIKRELVGTFKLQEDSTPLKITATETLLESRIMP